MNISSEIYAPVVEKYCGLTEMWIIITMRNNETKKSELKNIALIKFWSKLAKMLGFSKILKTIQDLHLSIIGHKDIVSYPK